MVIAALIVSIVAALGALTAGVFAGLAWWQSKRQADATKESADQVRRSADAAERSAKSADEMKEFAKLDRKENFDRWLAANKPWIRIAFPDELRRTCTDGHIDIRWRKQDAQAPQLISVENIGHLPCRVVSCSLADQVVNGELVQSSAFSERAGGFLIGTTLAGGEALTFCSEDLVRIVKSNLPETEAPLKITYEFEPLMKAEIEYSALIEKPSKPQNANWVDLVLLENKRHYREWRITDTSPETPPRVDG